MHRDRSARDKPVCDQLNGENATLTGVMFTAKDAQERAVRDVEQYRQDRSSLVHRRVNFVSVDMVDTAHKTLKEALNDEIKSIEEAITRTRARIVQSPERIKKTISIMSTTAMEDKKTVMMHETKARDLQTKINALLNIEKVSTRIFLLLPLNQPYHRMSEAALSRFKR